MSVTDDSRAGDDESELLRRLCAGDRQVLGELFDRHRERLWRMVRFRMDRRLAARVDPDDVLQEAFLDADRRLHHFLEDPSRSLFIWFRLIVGQTLVDVHRRHLGAGIRDAGRDVSLASPVSPLSASVSMAAGLLASITSPSQAVARDETARQLEQAIASMAPLDQEILALRHFEDLSNAEAAELLQIQPSAASNRYMRALTRLREILAKFPEFSDASPPGQ